MAAEDPSSMETSATTAIEASRLPSSTAMVELLSSMAAPISTAVGVAK